MEDHLSWDELYPFLEEVKALARGLLRHEHHASLQTTALVLSALRRQRHADQDWQTVTWANRQYFFGALYRAMTRALLDHARMRARRVKSRSAPRTSRSTICSTPWTGNRRRSWPSWMRWPNSNRSSPSGGKQ